VSLPRSAGRAPALTCRENRPRAQRPGNGQRRPPVTRSGLHHGCPASEARLCATPRSATSLPPEALGHRRLKPLNHMRASNLLSDGYSTTLGRLLLAPARSSGAWEQSGFLPRAGGKELENGPSAEQQAQERAIDGIHCHNAQALGLVRLASAARCNLIELELRALRLDELLEQGVCFRAPPETSSSPFRDLAEHADRSLERAGGHLLEVDVVLLEQAVKGWHLRDDSVRSDDRRLAFPLSVGRRSATPPWE